MKVKIEIGELVLYGIDKESATHMGKVIERELSFLIKNNGIPKKIQTQSKFIPSLDGRIQSLSGSTNLTDTNLLGRSIARSVYSSFDDKT